MKVVIGNYPDPNDSRNLILNAEVSDVSGPQSGSILFAIISKIEGIETAPYRNGTGDWSGADGGYISSQLYSARTITISGTYIDRRAGCDYSATNVDQFDHLARLYIRSRLPIRKKQFVRLFMDSGMTFYTEGYCVDIRMDYTFIGHGDYQISIYCPDPALYRGSQDGTLGSEWNIATLRKTNDTGYISRGTDSLGDPYFTVWEKGDGENTGVVWGTGGRSTPIVYTGDFPYAPQFVIEPRPGETVVNPQFFSTNEEKFFGLGVPETDIARYVVHVDTLSPFIDIEEISAGSYDADYSSVVMFQNLKGNTGSGLEVDIKMVENDGRWSIDETTILDQGSGYQEGDIVSPVIPGASAFVVSGGDKLVIDMSEHLATLNGESVSYNITPGSEWLQLEALTTNNIVFSSASENDAEIAQVRWRQGYQGV